MLIGLHWSRLGLHWFHKGFAVLLWREPVVLSWVLGAPLSDATEAQIIKAAKLAEADEFIKNLPNKYHTQVGQNGIMLSGGQRQRIAIARAILYDSPILLLDEATSALDPISEHLIKNALNKLMKGKTTIVIAHRLSTVMHADKICVVMDGKITTVSETNRLLVSMRLLRVSAQASPFVLVDKDHNT